MCVYILGKMLTIEIKLQNRKYLFSTASLQRQTSVRKMLQQPQTEQRKAQTEDQELRRRSNYVLLSRKEQKKKKKNTEKPPSDIQ